MAPDTTHWMALVTRHRSTTISLKVNDRAWKNIISCQPGKSSKLNYQAEKWCSWFSGILKGQYWSIIRTRRQQYTVQWNTSHKSAACDLEQREKTCREVLYCYATMYVHALSLTLWRTFVLRCWSILHIAPIIPHRTICLVPSKKLYEDEDLRQMKKLNQ